MTRNIEMIAYRDAGYSYADIGHIYGVSKQAVHQAVNRKAAQPMTLNDAYDFVLAHLRARRNLIDLRIQEILAREAVEQNPWHRNRGAVA